MTHAGLAKYMPAKYMLLVALVACCSVKLVSGELEWVCRSHVVALSTMVRRRALGGCCSSNNPSVACASCQASLHCGAASKVICGGDVVSVHCCLELELGARGWANRGFANAAHTV